jgi:UDP-2,3-diacylglucosamine pyrophosphatase LpxH
MSNPALDQPLLFISDVHLGGFSAEENARIESELIGLIDYCQKNEIRLAILGDLFDYWMEYPNEIPALGEKLLNRFENFNKKSGPTLYITGNHDNWTRDHLPQRGFYLEHEQHTFSLNNQTIMTLHGDGLSNSDFNLKRPYMHQFLRSDSFVRFFQAIFPAQVGISVMKYFSRITRRMDWDSRKEEKLNRWSKNQLDKTDVDIILCGHDHIPRWKQFPFGTYINLGTFYEHKTMAFYNNNAISLVCWDPVNQSLNKFDPADK